MKRAVGVFVITATAVALWSAVASAAAPTLIGAGSLPAVAIDQGGTAYIVYNGTENNAALHFCRLPRGATACSTTSDLPVPASGFTGQRPFVSVSGATVRVLSYRFGLPAGNRDLLYTSGDGGASFGAPTEVGDLPPDVDPAAGPGGGISIVNSASGSHQYQLVPTDGSGTVTARATLSTTAYPYGGAVGLADANTPLVAFNDGAGTPTSAFSVYKGFGSVNDDANWTAPQVIGPGASEHLASGSSGLFLMLYTGGRYEVRKYEGAAFGAPVVLPDSQTNFSGEHLFQDAAGTLHASWTNASGTVSYATSPDGKTWVTQQVVTGAAGPTGPRLAAASDHRGFAVYTLGTGTNAAVYAVGVGPPPPPPSPPAAGSLQADFSWSPTLPCTYVPVRFSATPSTVVPGNPIINYRWTFTNSAGPDPDRPGHTLPPGPFGIDRPTIDSGTTPEVTLPFSPSDIVQLGSRPGVSGGTTISYRGPVSVTLAVIDNQGRQSTATRVVSFGDPKRTVKVPYRNPLSGVFSAQPPDPITICRVQKGLRKVPQATFTQAVPKATASGVVSAASCPAGASQCRGFFGAIADKPRGIISRAQATTTKHPKSLGSKSFTLAPGQKKTLKLKFSNSARALIHRRHLKRVTVVLMTVDSRGARHTHTKVAKLGH